MSRLILASTSPYRRQLLARLGLELETCDPQVEEAVLAGEKAADMASRLANAKADSAAQRLGPTEVIVIGADQVASLNGQLLRKPGDRDTALKQLVACQGATVVFHTATTVIDCPSGRRWEGIDHTQVHFSQLDEARLQRYIELEEPYDCAGGFKAEGLGIVLFEAIESDDPTALLGLPLIWVTKVLRELGLDPLDGSLSAVPAQST